MTAILHESVRMAAAAVAERALRLDRSCLRETREDPFEKALADELNRLLPAGFLARKGGLAALDDFPGLGPYDVSVSGLGASTYAAVIEFKWWSPPGLRSGVVDKRRETLWDCLKVACSIASQDRAAAGYLVVLAPDAAWDQDHPFSRLAREDRAWETSLLCRAPENPMRYFDDRHYGVTAIPELIETRLLGSTRVLDPCHDEPWSLKALAIEPRGPMNPLERVHQHG